MNKRINFMFFVTACMFLLLLLTVCRLGVDPEQNNKNQITFDQGDGWVFKFRIFNDTLLGPHDTLSGKIAVTVKGTENLRNTSLITFNLITVYDQNGDSVKKNTPYSFKIYMHQTDSYYVAFGYTPTGKCQTPLLKAAIEPSVLFNKEGEKTYVENEAVISFPRYLYEGNKWVQRPNYYEMTIKKREEILLEYSNNKSIMAYRVQAVPDVSLPPPQRQTYYYWIDSLGVVGGTIAKPNFYFDFERIHYSKGNDVLLDPTDY